MCCRRSRATPRAASTTSLTNLQYPDRGEFLTALGSKMASATELASIEDIETLWFELQREVNESGKVVSFNHLVQAARRPAVRPDDRSRRLVQSSCPDAGYLKVTDEGNVS